VGEKMAAGKRCFLYAIFFVFLVGPVHQAIARSIEAGPIWNNDDAKGKCSKVCADSGMEWDGNWVTTIPGKASVCECRAITIQAIPQASKELEKLPGHAQEEGLVLNVFPEKNPEILQCAGDARCREAARDKIDQELLQALLGGKPLSPGQSEYAKDLFNKLYTHNLTQTQEEIAFQSPQKAISQW
jgi:hypothetical protein